MGVYGYWGFDFVWGSVIKEAEERRATARRQPAVGAVLCWPAATGQAAEERNWKRRTVVVVVLNSDGRYRLREIKRNRGFWFCCVEFRERRGGAARRSGGWLRRRSRRQQRNRGAGEIRREKEREWTEKKWYQLPIEGKRMIVCVLRRNRERQRDWCPGNCFREDFPAGRIGSERYPFSDIYINI